MIEKVRAKFYCSGIEDQPDYKQKVVGFYPVTTGSEENKSFAKYTPGGSMQLIISYETPASDFFEAGKLYYLDITKAE
jgi:hypothetical protein